MNKTQDKFSLPAVTLSIFAAAAAERLPVCSSSRALLWQEVLAAVLLMILSALASRFWQSGPFFFLMIRPPPRSTLLPYTALFRSRIAQRDIDDGGPNGVVLNTPPCTKTGGERCVGMRCQAMNIGLALRRMLAVLVCDMPQSMNVLFEKERSQGVIDVRHGAGVAVGRGAILSSHVSSADH